MELIGIDGVDGQTPYIGENGNWWIGNEDTGVKAESTDFIYDDRGEGTFLIAYVGNDYDVVIPEKTTAIGKGAFAGNKIINTVKIPQNVKFIGDSAFENCINLCTISLPNNLLAIGDSAFAGCTQFKRALRIKVFLNFLPCLKALYFLAIVLLLNVELIQCIYSIQPCNKR